jgi:hypothetical protein
MEAMRCIKRRLPDIVFQQMLEDSLSTRGRARQDAGETTLTPSAAGSHPHTSSSDNSLPHSSPTSLKHTPDGVLTQNDHVRMAAANAVRHMRAVPHDGLSCV